MTFETVVLSKYCFHLSLNLSQWLIITSRSPLVSCFWGVRSQNTHQDCLCFFSMLFHTRMQTLCSRFYFHCVHRNRAWKKWYTVPVWRTASSFVNGVVTWGYGWAIPWFSNLMNIFSIECSQIQIFELNFPEKWYSIIFWIEITLKWINES